MTNENGWASERGLVDPRDDCPTYKQVRFMKHNGLWDEREWYSKEDACQIIGEFLARKRFNRSASQL